MIIHATYRLPDGTWHAEFICQSVEELADLLEGREHFRVWVSPDDLPPVLAELRRLSGMTQRDLGQRIGYPAPVVGNIEQGSRKLGLATLSRIAEALGGRAKIFFEK